MTEALVISFQTQLSAVMETVLKTTMYEVTRLVEENFLEQVDRGKREVEVLRRRLILSEAKLRERERFKRVRCVDCGRTAVSKRRMLNRSFDTQGGLEQRAVIKLEKDSVEAPKAGEVKEETTNRDACIVIRSQKHSQTDTSTSESNGNADPDRKCLKDIACGPAERSGDEDEMIRKNQAKWFDPTSDRIGSVSLTDPVGVSPSPEADGSRQQLSCTDSGRVKPEVVVMLPPDWEEMERITPQVVSDTMPQLEVQRGDQLITRSQEEKQVPQLPVTVQRFTPQAMQNLQPANQPGRSLVKKNARIVLQPRTVGSDQDAVPVDRVNPVFKSLPASIPSHVRQFPEGAGERSFSNINPGRSVPQGVGIRVQGDTRNSLQRMVHSCNQCGKGFSHLCHLRAHQQIHTGERQFCCTICGRSFTKLSNLKAHRRVHTGERPYICTDCGKRFTQKCNLKRHQRIHSDFTNSNS